MTLLFGLLVAGCGKDHASGDGGSSSDTGTSEDASTGCGIACAEPGQEMWKIETRYSDCDRVWLTSDSTGAVYLDGFVYTEMAAELSRLDETDGSFVWTVPDVPASTNDVRHLAVAGWRTTEGVLLVTQNRSDTGLAGAAFQEHEGSGAVVSSYVIDDDPAISKFAAMSVDGEDGIWAVVELDQDTVEVRQIARGGAVAWTSSLGTLETAPSFAAGSGSPTAGTVLMGRKTTDVLASYRPDGSTWTTEMSAANDAADVFVDATGAVYVAATEFSSDTDSRVHLLSFTPEGAAMGDIVHDLGGEEFSDRARKIVVDDEGAIILASDEDSGESGPFSTRARLTRYSADGSLAWTQEFEPKHGAAARASACDVTVGADGLVVFAFETDAGSDAPAISVHAFAP